MKRQHSHTMLLRRLIAERGSQCQFCRSEVVQVASIAKRRRLCLLKDRMVFLDDRGQRREVKIATVEHIVRLADKGTYDDSNLAVACFTCNASRNSEAVRKHYIQTQQRTKCRHCNRQFGGGCYRYGTSRSCVSCHEKHSRICDSKSGDTLAKSVGMVLAWTPARFIER